MLLDMGGVSAWVEQYDGSRITVPRFIDPGDDPRFWISPLFASADETFACVRFIDPYGRTVFNRCQVPVVATELTRLIEQATMRQRGELSELRALANFAHALPHRFLVFMGD